MQVVYELAPVIADVIAAHCPSTKARELFMHACLNGNWEEAGAMVEGMLAEPWHLRGYQEDRLREFLAMTRLDQHRRRWHLSTVGFGHRRRAFCAVAARPA